jgi:DNA-binding transcriptional LysR family regulator
MDRLDAMQLYVAVVDAHSFARAAEVLGQPRSTVSRVVKELEAWLGRSFFSAPPASSA